MADDEIKVDANGKPLQEYPKLVKNPDGKGKTKVLNKKEEDAVLGKSKKDWGR